MKKEAIQLNVGDKYRRLTVVGYSHKEKNRHLWLFKCDCGEMKLLQASFVTRENGYKSCGCLYKERKTVQVPLMNRTHGLSKKKFYVRWLSIKRRCYYPKAKGYANYGGRGITVCDRWQDYMNFHNDMYESYIKHVEEHGEKNTSIDRIDGELGYSPENCRWTTVYLQSINRRTNRYITFNGVTKTVGEWAREYNMNKTTLLGRINKGYSPEEALYMKIRERRKK